MVVDAFNIFISLDRLVIGRELDWNGVVAVRGVVDVVKNLQMFFFEGMDIYFGVDIVGVDVACHCCGCCCCVSVATVVAVVVLVGVIVGVNVGMVARVAKSTGVE